MVADCFGSVIIIHFEFFKKPLQNEKKKETKILFERDYLQKVFTAERKMKISKNPEYLNDKKPQSFKPPCFRNCNEILCTPENIFNKFQAQIKLLSCISLINHQSRSEQFPNAFKLNWTVDT